MLTKADVNALRKADSLCVHLSKDYTMARAIKRNPKTEADPFAQDAEHLLTCSIELDSARGREEIANGRAKCAELIWLYRGLYHMHSATMILGALREGDEITFKFAPDYHTNGYVAAAGLHADSLLLEVRRNGKTAARWELQTGICPDNSARMCKGIPNCESYEHQAAEARKVA